GLDVAAIHALRTLDGLDVLTKEAARESLHQALSHPSAGVIRTAIEVLPRDAVSRQALLESNALQSEDAQIRLSALLALAEMPPSPDAAREILSVMPRNQSDRWLRDAATSAAATNGGEFLKLVCGEPANQSAPMADVVAIVAQHLARSTDETAIVNLLPSLPEAGPAVSVAIVRGFANGWPKSTKLELAPEADASLVTLLSALPAASKGRLIRLGQTWGSQNLAKNAGVIAASLMETASSDEHDPMLRIDAAKQLITLMSEDAEVAADLLDAITPRTPQSAAIGMIAALQASRAPGVGKTILNAMDAMTPAGRVESIRVLLSRPDTTVDLLDAVRTGQLAREDLTLQQQQSLLGHPTVEIRRKSRQVLSGDGGLPSPDRQKVLASYMQATNDKGNVERGKSIYTKNCANCHTHNGEGKKVGPDLTGMAVHPKAELLTHILDPSRSVEGNYRSYAVLTLDGIVVNGMLASETQTAVEIFDAQGKKQVVLREDIDRLVASKKSVMPEGFEKQIDIQGFTDLLEFLTAKGRFLPLPLDKVATAVSTKGLFHPGDNGADRFVLDDWSRKMVGETPFQLIDPQGKRVRNLVLLNGPRGTMPPRMPKSVVIPCNAPARTIHLLSGVSGWGYPAHQPKSVSMTVRLHLADGSTEDHPLSNGVHFADYIRRVDVPESEFAMLAGGQQLRHIRVNPNSNQVIREIELVKGDDPTAPIVMAITVEGPSK
ncbi:MAG: c-type cytochrome, partial [Rubripirellula sp.]